MTEHNVTDMPFSEWCKVSLGGYPVQCANCLGPISGDVAAVSTIHLTSSYIPQEPRYGLIVVFTHASCDAGVAHSKVMQGLARTVIGKGFLLRDEPPKVFPP